MPQLGVGVGWRAEADLWRIRHAFNWVEVISEHFMGPERQREAMALAHEFPVVPHGIELSIGSDGPLDERYLADLAALVTSVGAPWCSDHLCFTRTRDVQLGMLTPLLRTEEAASAIAQKARQVQDAVGVPFLLENIANHFAAPGALDEAAFLSRVVSESGCWILLDVTNLWLNASNYGFRAHEYLDALPMDRVLQVHIAGGHAEDGRLVDSHSSPVASEVWALLARVANEAPLRGILLERDDCFTDDLADMVCDLHRASTYLSHAS